MNSVQQNVSIAAGASLSASINLGEGNLASLIMPAAWTAAILTFQGSIDGVNFYDLFDEAGNEIQYTAAAMALLVGKMVPVDAYDSAACNYIKLRSGTSASAVNQTVARTFGIVTRRYE
jgi:hypothetical protein